MSLFCVMFIHKYIYTQCLDIFLSLVWISSWNVNKAFFEKKIYSQLSHSKMIYFHHDNALSHMTVKTQKSFLRVNLNLIFIHLTDLIKLNMCVFFIPKLRPIVKSLMTLKNDKLKNLFYKWYRLCWLHVILFEKDQVWENSILQECEK